MSCVGGHWRLAQGRAITFAWKRNAHHFDNETPRQRRRFAINPKDVFASFDIVVADDFVALRQKFAAKPIEQARALLCTFEPEINAGEAGLRV